MGKKFSYLEKNSSTFRCRLRHGLRKDFVPKLSRPRIRNISDCRGGGGGGGGSISSNMTVGIC